ncbi:YihY/virulence factor BrkB family protein [Cytophagaceae bacterium ABcell3]|nr:YihY/virulence factor BrkB family protein [Cytophagaceae bacterium ABcell3]
MKNKLKSFYSNKIKKPLWNKLQHTYLPKEKVPVASVLEIFINKMLRDGLDDKASAMAFNFILSVFPGVIFLFTLLPFFPIPALAENILDLLSEAFPESIYEPIETTIIDIVENQRGRLLSFGFISAVFFATNGIRTMMITFNRSYYIVEDRGFLKRVFVSIIIGTLLLLSVILIVAISFYVNIYLFRLQELIGAGNLLTQYVLVVMKYVLFLSFFIITIAITYYIAPATKKTLRFFSPGVFTASFLCLLFTFAFSFYVNNFDSYNRLYGSIGALMGAMVWVYSISIMLLIGFELDVSIDIARKKIKAKKS